MGDDAQGCFFAYHLRALRALSDGACHALRGYHRRAARRRELVDVVPRRVPLLLQLLLLEPELLVVSLAPSAAHRSGVGYWPVRARGGFVDPSLGGASGQVQRRHVD